MPFPLCFQPLFPILESSMKLTHTPQASCAWPLSRLINYFPPLEGPWVGVQRGLCSLNHGRNPQRGQVSEALERCLLPSSSLLAPAESRARFRSAPIPGIFWLAGRECGVWTASPHRPAVTCSPLGAGVRQSVISDLLGCGFLYQLLPRGPGTCRSKGKELLGPVEPLPDAN